MSLLIRTAVAAVSGVAVTWGFPPHDLLVLLIAGLVGLIAALRGASARVATLVGFVFGTVFMASLMPWLRVIGTDAWLGVAVTEGLFYALFGWAFARTAARPWWPVSATFCWVAMEYLRSVVPFHGFPWGRLAFAMTDTPLAAYARWLGVPALSGVVFALACLLVLAWTSRAKLRSAVLAIGGVVAVVGGALVLPVGLASAAGSVDIATIQGDVPGTGADGLGQQQEVLRNHAALTAEYAAQVRAGTAPAADIVLWPENASDIDPFTSPGVEDLIDSAVRDVGVPTLVGSIVDGPRPGTARNVGIVWDPQNGAGDTYVKRHLVPFGEYIPFRSLLAPYVSRLDQIPRDMLPGDDPGVLQIGPALIGDMMCFDVAYDDIVRDVARNGAQLLVVQTNNATYLGTDQPEQQWAISRMRAIETGKDVVVASTNGISGVANATGEVVSRSASGQPQILVDTVRLGSGVTWGVRVGGWLEYGLSLTAAALLLLSVLRGRRERRSTGLGDDASAVSASEPGQTDALLVGKGAS
ncbi:MAG: apolipoprotein N-acyltransferase [Nocardioidaceae bacterium]|nr:apolipoprotein N-acyltransferase [Nocardioidaceae bacterium]